MKGFRPTGYGPSSGFRFPKSMGFSGSTDAFTNVQPYIRRKAFASGGVVRQDNPRMKTESIGDQGSGLVRRAKSSSSVDQESGGKTPLRPGFKRGGVAKKQGGGMMVAGHGPLSLLGRAKAKKMLPPIGAAKGRFYAADGGKAEFPAPKYSDAVIDRIKSLLGVGPDSTGLAKIAAEKLRTRQRQIDDVVDSAVTGTERKYSRGGRTKTRSRC